jgi:hypothetical protein
MSTRIFASGEPEGIQQMETVIIPQHWFIILLVGEISLIFGIPYLAYQHGKKVGDQQGYIRGLKEGQQSGGTGRI